MEASTQIQNSLGGSSRMVSPDGGPPRSIPSWNRKALLGASYLPPGRLCRALQGGAGLCRGAVRVGRHHLRGHRGPGYRRRWRCSPGGSHQPRSGPDPHSHLRCRGLVDQARRHGRRPSADRAGQAPDRHDHPTPGRFPPFRSPWTCPPPCTSTTTCNGMLLGISNQDQEPGFCREFDYQWLPAFDRAAEIVRALPGGQELEVGWAGLYENTPDHNAMIGSSDTVPGLLVRHGFSGPRFPAGPGSRRARQGHLPGPRVLHGPGTVQCRPLRRRALPGEGSPHHLSRGSATPRHDPRQHPRI